MTQVSVIAVERSQDSKLSIGKKCSATWISQASCPTSCPFFQTDGKDGGCYANHGRAGMITRRLNASLETDPTAIAEAEAAAIDALPGKYDLRLHVVGDCKTAWSAEIVSGAAQRYVARSGKRVWTYTHAWKDVPRSSWGATSVLASCQTLGEVKEAHAQGWAPALVVSKFEKDTVYPLGDGFKLLPCCQQTGKADSCVNCGACMIAEKLYAAKIVIGFHAHGNVKAVSQALQF